MSRGFPRIGAKPSPANPGNYVKDFARSIKHKSRRRISHPDTPPVKFNISATPILAETHKHDTLVTGYRVLGIIFLISLLAFLALILLN